MTIIDKAKENRGGILGKMGSLTGARGCAWPGGASAETCRRLAHTWRAGELLRQGRPGHRPVPCRGPALWGRRRRGSGTTTEAAASEGCSFTGSPRYSIHLGPAHLRLSKTSRDLPGPTRGFPRPPSLPPPRDFFKTSRGLPRPTRDLLRSCEISQDVPSSRERSSKTPRDLPRPSSLCHEVVQDPHEIS